MTEKGNKIKKILFFGDSITDSGTSVHPETAPGHGFIRLIESSVLLDFPGEREFINKGINSHTTNDLLNRLQKDVIDLEPDVLTILAGVNDVYQSILGTDRGMSNEESFEALEKIVQNIKEKLPQTKIIMMAPFVLLGSVTENDFRTYLEEVSKRAENARIISEKYKLFFVPLQEKFDALLKVMPESYWLLDGVHPTPAGHEIIKREWIRAFKSLL